MRRIEEASPRPGVVFIVPPLLVVVMRDEGRGMVERVVVEAILPAHAAPESVAVAHLISVSKDCRNTVAIDSLGNVEDHLGTGVVNEVTTPSACGALGGAPGCCSAPSYKLLLHLSRRLGVSIHALIPRDGSR